MTNTNNTFDKLTEKIIAEMEAGVNPWAQPWINRPVQNAITGHRYSGFNHLILASCGFEDPRFLTFKQAKEAGGSVKKGEKAIAVLFMTNNVSYSRKAKDQTGATDDQPILEKVYKEYEGLIARVYHVFNVSQCEGLKPELMVAPISPEMGDAAQIAANMPNRPEILPSNNAAAYSPVTDQVFMPPRTNFNSDADYFLTLFHELGHATGHKSRLDRPALGVTRMERSMNDTGVEELTAELTAAFVGSTCGIDLSSMQTPAYIKSWLGAVKDQPKALIQAASAATKAANYILGN